MLRGSTVWRVMVAALGLLAALGLATVLLHSGPTEASDTTFTVNSNDDVDDGACDTVHCSLREAINAANATAGKDTIAFNIPGTGPHTIQPTSALPTITDPVIIDGYTQPGASPNTNPVGLGLNTALMIELDGRIQLWVGLDISAGDSTVRGLVINRFLNAGIWLETSGGNVIEGNFIGTDVTGTVALGKGGGIFAGASNNTIGGTAAGARNLISGNPMMGIELPSTSSDNVVQGNLIGTDITGSGDVGGASGAGGGVQVGWHDNTIGGTTPGAANTIAFNGGSGVTTSDHLAVLQGNAILSNWIFANGALGIDLGQDGVTPNDPGDGDTGPNKLQNFPVLSWAVSGSSTTIEGMLNSAPDTEFRLEFFSNSECDVSGYGEGEKLLGSAVVTTDGSGDADFEVTLAETVPAGHFVTATATDPDGNTSEFSACVEVPEGLTPVPTATPTYTPVGTPTPAANTIVVSPADSGVVAPGDTFTVDIDLVEAELAYVVVQAQLEWDAAALEHVEDTAGSLIAVGSATLWSGDPPGTEQIYMGGLVSTSPVNTTGQVWSVTLRCDVEGGPYTLHLVSMAEDPMFGTGTGASPAWPPQAVVLEDGQVICGEAGPTATPATATPTHTPVWTPSPGANTMVVNPADSGVVAPGDTFTVDIDLVSAELAYMTVQAQLEWDAAALEHVGNAAGPLISVPGDAAVVAGDPPGKEDIRVGGSVSLSPVKTTGTVWSVTLRSETAGGPYPLHLVSLAEDPVFGTGTAGVAGQPQPMALVDGQVISGGAMPTPTATSTPTPTPPPVRMEKDLDEDPTEIVDAANLFLHRDPATGELECLTIYELVSNVGHDPDGVGSYEFQLKYDHKVFDIDIEDASWLSNGGTREVDCSMSIFLENDIRWGCVSWGPTPGQTADGVAAIITVCPEADLVNRLTPGQENGVVRTLLDENCELADVYGDPLPGTLPGGLLEVCSDMTITVRILEADLDLDCEVDVADAAAIAFRYGSVLGNVLYDPWYDLEPTLKDFDVDIKDLQKVFGRQGSTCEVPIPEQDPVAPPP